MARRFLPQRDRLRIRILDLEPFAEDFEVSSEEQRPMFDGGAWHRLNFQPFAFESRDLPRAAMIVAELHTDRETFWVDGTHGILS